MLIYNLFYKIKIPIIIGIGNSVWEHQNPKVVCTPVFVVSPSLRVLARSM